MRKHISYFPQILQAYYRGCIAKHITFHFKRAARCLSQDGEMRTGHPTHPLHGRRHCCAAVMATAAVTTASMGL
ncbi:Hypothetical predicted protein [Xyrichtys novacula]|uniref:Uncharacterized protein n=1 Tax=Xyrichtys novacula TaxID=13765 RepID=A0AAV1HFF4_XYRNO|nr:Hypothetical predicted protein [Xyrichtys novacula]